MRGVFLIIFSACPKKNVLSAISIPQSSKNFKKLKSVTDQASELVDFFFFGEGGRAPKEKWKEVTRSHGRKIGALFFLREGHVRGRAAKSKFGKK